VLLVMVVAGGLILHRWDKRARRAWGEVVGRASLLDDAIRSRQLSLVDRRETRLHSAVKRLGRVRWVQLSDSRRLRVALDELATAASETHAAADAENQAMAEHSWARAKAALACAKQAMPARMADAMIVENDPVLYSCPMHADVGSEKPGLCPKCGMPLAPPEGRVGPYVTARVSPATLVRVGEVAQRTLELSAPDGKPITFAHLAEVHTKKIHLLIVDESLIDYKHEHPTPTGVDGQYSFSFVPSRPGPYHVWADVMPTATQVPEFPRFTMAGYGTGESLPSTDVQLTDSAGPLHFELSVGGSLTRGSSTPLRLVVSQDGAVFTKLEPIMGTYAHLVAFSEDLKEILHIHPLGPAPSSADDRGLGSLDFSFRPRTAGIVVMFAQIQVGETSRFGRFVLQVDDGGLAKKAGGAGAGL
jgi:hypothetical protein